LKNDGRETYQYVSGVGDGCDDSGSDHHFFPALCDVDDVNSIIASLVNVWLHQTGAVLSTKVALHNGKKWLSITWAVSIRAISYSFVFEYAKL